MVDIAKDEVKMASLLIKKLLEQNDPLIHRMIDWYMIDYDEDREFVEQELRKRPTKREQFYMNFLEKCKDRSLRKGFNEKLYDFFSLEVEK